MTATYSDFQLQGRFGLTEHIFRIAKQIFESLPREEATTFFADFPDGVAFDGKNLSLVHWHFLASELRSLPPQPSYIQAAIDPVITGMDLLASGQEWPEDAAKEAGTLAYWTAEDAPRANEDATKVAQGAAWCAAGDAHWAIWANSAPAWAAFATNAAVWAAEDARTATVRRQRDLLLRLIQEAPLLAVAFSWRHIWHHPRPAGSPSRQRTTHHS